MSSFELSKQWQALDAFWRARFQHPLHVQGALWVVVIQEFPLLTQKADLDNPVEKGNLLHVATCFLLSELGFYRYEGTDEEGWPQFEVVRNFEALPLAEQEANMGKAIIAYFIQYLPPKD